MSIFNLFEKNNKTVNTNPGKSTVVVTGDKHVSETAVESKQKVTDKEQATLNAASTAKNVYNLIILDESGSMMSIYHPALSGINETLRTIRMAQEEHPEQTHFVSLVAFDSNHYNQIYDCVEAAKTKDITKKQYRPGACTPLYDAMGRSINELRDRLKDGDVVLVTIITDGYENASHEYSGKAIKVLVESLKSQGWVFTYIGANQDVERVACEMSINNFMAFDADEESTTEMFAKEKKQELNFSPNLA